MLDAPPERRTRSQLALPDAILKIPRRSPMKDAKARTAEKSVNKFLDETEDELLLSPRKQEGRSKRSATPEPQDEYSVIVGSPSCGRKLKRVKRDASKEGQDVSAKMAQYAKRFIDSGHARNNTAISPPAVEGKPRKRSAMTSKKPMSTLSESPPPSVYSPVASPKERARSVPLLTAAVNIPRIDFRNPPPTPVRWASSPVKEKLRIMSGTIKSPLPTISDEQTSPMDMSDGSTSVPEEKELLPTEKSVDAKLLKSATGIAVVPATPMTGSLNKLMPLSPLTPIAETPFTGHIAPIMDTASRYDVDVGWSKNPFKEFESSTATTVKPPLTINSRLPRPVAPPRKHSKLSTARLPQPSIFAKSEAGGKLSPPFSRPGLKMREKMRPKAKSKIPPGPLLIAMEDDEEIINGDGGQPSTLGATRHSPELGPSTLRDSSTPAEEEVKKKDDDGVLEDAKMSVDLQTSSDASPVETTKMHSMASFPIDEAVLETNQVEESLESEPPAAKAGPSKFPLGKKRQPTSIAPVGRVTRSASQQKSRTESSEQVKGKRSAAPVPSALKSTAPGRFEMIDSGAGKLTLAKSPAKSKSFIKPVTTPSPSKIARATSMFIKPTITTLTRPFPTDLGNPTSAASKSSLSTLSNALDKLRMPPPSRPNTSMGFNEDSPGDNDVLRPSSKDDTVLNHGSLVTSAVGLKRSATLGAGAFRGAAASSSKSKERNGKVAVQMPLSMFMSAKGTDNGLSRKAGASKPSLFGVGGPIRRTISKKSSLPMVVGSPVKGGGNNKAPIDDGDDPAEDASGVVGDDSAAFFAPLNVSKESVTMEDLEAGQEQPSTKGKEKAIMSNASRRVSMVSHALSQSLSSLPQSSTQSQGLMEPSPTPPSARGGSSRYPHSSTSDKTSPRQGAVGMRSSARIATKMTQTKVQEEAQNASSEKDKEADVVQPPNPVPESLKILNDCVIVVDVKTDEGDEAGSLFVEMLEGIGAKVLSRVGQTCTHVVYKNGLMSTLTRYRLLRDPKPLVVGIGWVVECVEYRKHADETRHLVDLDGVNVAGINKRRRSILPKLLADTSSSSPLANENSHEEGEDSLNLSASHDDDLAPLERARRRKNMTVGLHS